MNTNNKRPPPTMPSLPVDVIIDILCRLPVKILLRFRCVSKQFRFIIDGSDFINRHLQFHRSLNRRRLIVEEGLQPNLFYVDLDSADNAFKLGLPFEIWRHDVRVIGSCDGLLAVSFRRDTRICLWNISTRKHQILPIFRSDSDIFYDVLDGFGYDAATDDCKLVRAIEGSFYVTEVIVYSLKANSWRRIENYPPYHNYSAHELAILADSPSNKKIGVLVGGALNWVVAVLDINKCMVMSFDLKDEKFYEVPLPNIWDEVEAKAEFHVVALEGCLCLSYISRFETALDIWVMKEYGVKESWTKLFTLTIESRPGLDDFYPGIVAFTYSKSGNKLLVYEGDRAVYWHELDKKTNKSVEMNEWPTSILRATIYMDSLVSPLVDDKVVTFLGGRLM